MPAGRAVFEAQGCPRCHAVPSAGILHPTDVKVTAPVLADLADRHRARWLRRWLLRAKTEDGFTHLKKFEGTRQELDILVEWLRLQ